MVNNIKYLLVFALSLVAFNANAWKVKTDTTVYAGVWGGASYAKIMGYPQAMNPLIGMSYGLQFSYQPTREISIKTGIGFIPKGCVSDKEYFDIYDTSIGFFPTNHGFSYINIPFTLSYNLGQKKFNVYLSLGLDLDFLIKQETSSNDVPREYNGIEISNTNSINTDLYRHFQK